MPAARSPPVSAPAKGWFLRPRAMARSARSAACPVRHGRRPGTGTVPPNARGRSGWRLRARTSSRACARWRAAKRASWRSQVPLSPGARRGAHREACRGCHSRSHRVRRSDPEPPWRSGNRSPRRCRRTCVWREPSKPLPGSSVSCSCTSAHSPSKPFLKSVMPAASHTCTPDGRAIIVARDHRPDDPGSAPPLCRGCARGPRQPGRSPGSHLAPSWPRPALPWTRWPAGSLRCHHRGGRHRHREQRHRRCCGVRFQQPLLVQLAPPEDQVGVHAVHLRDSRYRGLWSQGLLYDVALLLGVEVVTAASVNAATTGRLPRTGKD